jgi:hypothetical protein
MKTPRLSIIYMYILLQFAILLNGCLGVTNPSESGFVQTESINVNSNTQTKTFTPALTRTFTPSQTITSFIPVVTNTNEIIPTASVKPTNMPLVLGQLNLNTRHLGYFIDSGIVILNPDGSGGKFIPIYGEIQSKVVSPSGEWIFLKICKEINEDKSICIGELSFQLLHLPDGKQKQILTINKFEKNEMDGFESINKPMWAPDCSYIAFTEKTSSNSYGLFTYLINNNQLTRLTNGSQLTLIDSISPDSKFILFSTIAKTPDGNNITLNLTKPNNAVNQGIKMLINYMRRFQGVEFYLNSWLNSKEILFSKQCSDSSQCQGMGILSIPDGNMISIPIYSHFDGPGISEAWAIDPINRKILIYSSLFPEKSDSGFSWNIIDFDGKQNPIELDNSILPGHWEEMIGTYFHGGMNNRFLFSYEGGVEGISILGKITHISNLNLGRYSQSVNGEYILYNDTTIEYYSKDDMLLHSYTGVETLDSVWDYENRKVYILGQYQNKDWVLLAWPIDNDKPEAIFTCNESNAICKIYWDYYRAEVKALYWTS